MSTGKDSQHGAHVATALPAGTPAPDFRLPTTPDQLVSLQEFRGSPVILSFFPADWSPVCGDQLALYNEVLPEFHRFRAALLGISVDGVWCHLAFARDRKFHFPLLADFEPKGQVASAYGVYRPHEGVCERAVRDRSRRRHPLEPCISHRSQPGRRRNSGSSRRPQTAAGGQES